MDEVLSHVKQCVHTVELMGYPYRLAVVKGNIWIPSLTHKGQYEVFHTVDGTLTQMSSEGLKGVQAFCQTAKYEVIAACFNGLYKLDTQGQVDYKLSEGVFADVCRDGERLVALERDKCQVQVYSQTNNRWMKNIEFTIKDPEPGRKTMHVANNSVYVCYHWTHKIYKYFLRGTYLEEYGSCEGKDLGQFDGPYVAGTDYQQALVVCDSGNNRIQLMNTSGEWKEYTIREVEMPRDVVVVGPRLFVLWMTNSRQKLSVFEGY